MNIKKYFSFFILTLTLVTFGPVPVAAEEQGSGVIDESIRDISIVIGAGAIGAVLGLSTLSFVERPSEHWKNVAVGGAVGIVIGVGAVIVNQATKSTNMAIGQVEVPVNPEKFATLSRHEFTSFKIAKNYLKEPSLGYTFNF